MKNYTITVNGISYNVQVEESAGAASGAPVATPRPAPVAAPAPQAVAVPTQAPKQEAPVAEASGEEGSVEIESPMPGKILSLPVKVGQEIKKGEVVVILEAMKMENEIVAAEDGTVASVNVTTGQMVEAGDLIATLN